MDAGRWCRVLVTCIVGATVTVGCSSPSRTAADRTTIADAAPTVAFIDAGGVRLRVRSVGPRDAKQTVLLIHGGPGLSLESLANLDALQGTDRRIVSYDQRGAGESDKPSDGDFGLDAQLRDIEAVRIWAGVNALDLLGQSWGGLFAAAYTAQNPDTVHGLILLDAAPLDWSAFLSGQQSFTDRETRLRAAGIVPATLPPDDADSCLPSLMARIPVYLASPTDPSPEFHTTCSASTARATYAAIQTPAAQAELTRLAGALGHYHGHALVIMGSEDPFGLGWLERSVQLLDGANVDQLVVPGAGHLSSIERPTVVLPAIDRWLDAS